MSLGDKENVRLAERERKMSRRVCYDWVGGFFKRTDETGKGKKYGAENEIGYLRRGLL